MFWVIAIILFGLMFANAGVPLDPMLFFLLFVVLMVWMSVRLMVGFVRWVSGSDELEARRALARSSPERGARKTCSDPHCGRINVSRARYCAQCGKPLRELRRGGDA
jgi:hypothetical protein